MTTGSYGSRYKTMMLVCAASLNLVFLYLIDRPLLVRGGVKFAEDVAFLTALETMLFYFIAAKFQDGRWIRALLVAGSAAIANVSVLLAIQYLFLPDIVDEFLIYIVESLTLQFVAIFIASVLTDSVFHRGRPLSDRGRVLVFCGLLSPIFFLLVQKMLWEREPLKTLIGDRLLLFIACLLIGGGAVISLWLASIVVTALKIGRQVAGYVTTISASVMTCLVFYAGEEILAPEFTDVQRSSSFDAVLSLAGPVFFGTLVACCVVRVFVRNPRDRSSQKVLVG